MQIRFTKEQTDQFVDAKKKYMAAVSKIMERPDHHSFDSLNAYIREIDKIFNLILTSTQARANEIVAQVTYAMMNGDDATLDGLAEAFENPAQITQELQAEINKYFVGDVEVNKLDEKYKNIEPRITGHIYKGDADGAVGKNTMGFLSKGVSMLKKTYGVTFSDGSTLTWNPMGNATELAAARSEFSHKMEYLANENRSVMSPK